MQGWMPLNEYSTKYNMSISTLRRRIRNSEVEFHFRDGKYWLKDETIPRGYKTTRPFVEDQTVAAEPLPKSGTQVGTYNLAEQFKDTAPVVKTIDHSSGQNHALEVADRLVAELKSAYVLILQEKEEMILQLKEEVSDLKTLARILEADNDRLKKEASVAASSSSLSFATEGSAMDRWLDEPLDP